MDLPTGYQVGSYKCTPDSPRQRGDVDLSQMHIQKFGTVSTGHFPLINDW